MTWLAFNPELRANTPAKSRLFMVRSKCKSDVDSGRNSANAMAPAEFSEVEDKKSRLRALFNVKAVRRDWTCVHLVSTILTVRGWRNILLPIQAHSMGSY